MALFGSQIQWIQAEDGIINPDLPFSGLIRQLNKSHRWLRTSPPPPPTIPIIPMVSASRQTNRNSIWLIPGSAPSWPTTSSQTAHEQPDFGDGRNGASAAVARARWHSLRS